MITSLRNFNLRSCNTFRIDATCAEYIEYTSADDLPSVMNIIDGRRFVNIGAGSNLLFTSDFDGVVLHSRILDVCSRPAENDMVIVRAGAGVTFDDLIQNCAISGLWGIENLSGIPGEVGAAAVQNVGAYGVEVCDVIRKVECYDTHARCFVEFHTSACEYGYRYSVFKNPDNKCRYIVTYVEIALSSVPRPRIDYNSLKERIGQQDVSTPTVVRQAVIDIRNSKLPPVDRIGSAGSFFKNPIVDHAKFEDICSIFRKMRGADLPVPHYDMGRNVKIPAAWLIDQCGLKGYEYENAAVWELQPLVIVNKTGKATAKEIIELERIIIKRVNDRFGVELIPEVEHV